jgi:outer membrane protein
MQKMITRITKGIPVGLILLVAVSIPEGLSAQRKITLDEALSIAMENSPDIKHARYNLKRSSASLNAARARLKSKGSLSVTPFSYINRREFYPMVSNYFTQETMHSYGSFQIEQPIALTDGTIYFKNDFSWRDSYSEFNDERDETYVNDIYIQFEQPLFTYNRTKLELRELELDLETNRLSYDIQKLAIEQRVVRAFYEVYQAKMNLDIAIEEYNNQEKAYYIMKDKVESGLETKEQFYQSELDLSNSRSSVQNRKVTLENARDSFKQVIGLSMYEDISLVADIGYQAVEVTLDKAIRWGLENRMELRQKEIEIENARDEVIEAGANNEFWGSLNLSYGITGTSDTWQGIYEKSPDENQQVSLSVEIPLWDWGEKENRIEASQATLESRKLSLDEQRDNIIIDIRKTYRSLKNQEVQIEIARQSVRNAQLTYDISMERYKNGEISSKELGEIQTQLSQAKVNRASALIEYKLLLLELKINSLWDFQRNCSAIERT